MTPPPGKWLCIRVLYEVAGTALTDVFYTDHHFTVNQAAGSTRIRIADTTLHYAHAYRVKLFTVDEPGSDGEFL